MTNVVDAKFRETNYIHCMQISVATSSNSTKCIHQSQLGDLLDLLNSVSDLVLHGIVVPLRKPIHNCLDVVQARTNYKRESKLLTVPEKKGIRGTFCC